MASKHQTMQEKDCNLYIFVLRALAVLSIVSSHCFDIPENASRISHVLSNILCNIGSIGVSVFFVLSGYVFPFSVEKSKDIFSFFGRKINGIFVPWFFCATIYYCYIWLRKGGSFSGWIICSLGYSSSFWYMSVLIMLFVLFFYLYRNKFFLLFASLVSVVSFVLIATKTIPHNSFTFLLNPFNWTIFFAFGVSLNKRGFASFISIISRMKFLLSFSAFLVLVIMACLGYRHYYSEPFFLPIEILCVFAPMSLGCIICEYPGRIKTILVELGKRSFSIYLLHRFVFAGTIVWLLNKTDLWMTIPLRPFIICGIVYFSISTGDWLSQKMHIEHIYSLLIGKRA